jgi:molecular chaperone HscB
MIVEKNSSTLTRVVPSSSTGIPVLQDDAAQGCWSCGDMRAAQFCHSCGKVQPPAPTDYFSFFGLSRRLCIDVKVLEREMYSLSRHLHPDLNGRASGQEQSWSLEQSSRLNDAYRTLRDPIARTEYLLNIEGFRRPDKSEARRQVPPDLLEEVFELNEQLEALRAKPLGSSNGNGNGNSSHAAEDTDHEAIVKAQTDFEGKLQACRSELRQCWEAWDHRIERAERGEEVGEHESHPLLEKMAEVLRRRKYITHLLGEIEDALG